LLIDIRADATVPGLAMELVEALATELARIDDQIATLDKKLMQLHRSNEMSRRLATIPGVGPIGATLLSIKVVDAGGFKSARNFAAWVGLTPKNHSTAGKNRLGVITRAGDVMLRTVLVAGATAVIADMRRRGSRAWPWLENMIARKPPKLVAIAEDGTCRIGRGGTFGASRPCEMLRSVYRQKMPLSCLDLTVREARLGPWSQDPKAGRTYERKRSEHAAQANPCKSGAVHI
jgi:hypothetical protein